MCPNVSMWFKERSASDRQAQPDTKKLIEVLLKPDFHQIKAPASHIFRHFKSFSVISCQIAVCLRVIYKSFSFRIKLQNTPG